jgi:hypothetical protein
MAWSAPATVNTGDTATAAWANVVVNDLIYLKGTTGTVTVDNGLSVTSDLTIGTNVIAGGTIMGDGVIFSTDSVDYKAYKANSSDFYINYTTGKYQYFDNANEHYAIYNSTAGVSGFSLGNCHGAGTTAATWLILRCTDGATLYATPNAARNGFDFTTTEP